MDRLTDEQLEHLESEIDKSKSYYFISATAFESLIAEVREGRRVFPQLERATCPNCDILTYAGWLCPQCGNRLAWKD